MARGVEPRRTLRVLLEFACGKFSVSTPCTTAKKCPTPHGVGHFLEQGTGVEPALTAWEAAVIPIYQPCTSEQGRV